MKPVTPQGSRKPIRWLITCSIAFFLLLVAMMALPSPSSSGKAGKAYAAVAATQTITPVSDPVVIITSPTSSTVFQIVQGPLLIPVSIVAIGTNSQPVVQVSLTVNGTQVGTATSSPYQIIWGVSMPGVYTLQAIATLSNGLMIFSPTVPITVQRGGSPTPTPSATPTPSPTSMPTPTPTPTSTQGAACSVHYAVTSQWQGGFGASITIKNTGTTTLNSWTLQFSFANGQTITQLWDGSYVQSGGAVTVTNLSYDGTLAPGTTVTPGFNATWNGTNSNPTSFTLNGIACSLN